MFLLEPKEQQQSAPNGKAITATQSQHQSVSSQNDNTKPAEGYMSPSRFGNYRQVPPLLPSSMPTSPARAVPMETTSPIPEPADPATTDRSKADAIAAKSTGNLAADTRGRDSPTRALRQTFESICVSPEKRKRSVDDSPGGSRLFSAEERMAPWSPTKRTPASPSLFNSPTRSNADDGQQPQARKKIYGRGVSLTDRFNNAASLSKNQISAQSRMDIEEEKKTVGDSSATQRTTRRAGKR